MKRFSLIAVMAVVATASSVNAVQVVGQVRTVDNYGPYQTGQGGEFTLQALENTQITSDIGYYANVAKNQYTASGTTPNFETFCVEGSEYIYPNTTFDVSVGNTTIYGGQGLTAGAAYLYYQFATGQLNYNYTGNRTASAGQLQNAIWYFMNQENQTLDVNNQYETLADSTFADPFALNSSLANPISVSVLSLWVPGQAGTDGGKRQDQLILTGDQGYSIPTPDGGTTAMLLGLALAGVASVGPRFRKQ